MLEFAGLDLRARELPGGSLGSSQYEYKSEKEKGLGFLTPINSLVSAVYSMHGRFLYG
jgi:hypothetical protein